MPELNQETFFDALAERLHASGVLSTYEEPKGQPHPEWPEWVKQNHASGKHNTPGLAYHVGDVPYDITSAGSTVDQKTIHHAFDIDNASILLETASIREAIKHYMPEREFAQYLDRKSVV